MLTATQHFFNKTFCSQWWRYPIKKTSRWKLSVWSELPLKTLHPKNLASLQYTTQSIQELIQSKSPPPPHPITDTPPSHASHPAKHLNLHPSMQWIQWADSQDTWVWDSMHSVHVDSCDDNNAAVTWVPTCSPGLLAESQVVMNLNRLMGFRLSLILLPLCFPLLRLTGKQRQLCAWNTLKHSEMVKFQITIDTNTSDEASSDKIHILQATAVIPSVTPLAHTIPLCHALGQMKSMHSKTDRTQLLPSSQGTLKIQGHLCPGFQTKKIWITFWRVCRRGKAK